tara:strand:- start:43 stop:456 length:414 start_codon:yes stop_codon:yes gene_type:complete
MKKILIMGLPGAGKTTLASKLVPLLKAKWLNADKVREEANDWDFSKEGRIRQANRMQKLADAFIEDGFYVVADFVCPTPNSRKIFNPNFIIWLDTIKAGRFEDTNEIFLPPEKYDLKVITKDADKWSLIARDMINKI